MDREYVIEEGSIVLFNPGDSHACVQSDRGTFDYRGFNISKEIMLDLAEEVTGKRKLPGFRENVIYDEEAACHLHLLHEMVMKGTGEFGKEETLLFLLLHLIQNYGQPSPHCIPECRQEIEKACEYMGEHFTEHIYLDQICHHSGLSKSTLLRAFTSAGSSGGFGVGVLFHTDEEDQQFWISGHPYHTEDIFLRYPFHGSGIVPF